MAASQLERAKARYSNLVERIQESASTAVRTAEIGMGSLALGMIQGGRPAGKEITIFKMPLELVSGIALHAGAVLGFGGAATEHLSNFGDAGVGSYLYLVGRGLGKEWRDKKGGGTTGDDFADRLSQIAASA